MGSGMSQVQNVELNGSPISSTLDEPKLESSRTMDIKIDEVCLSIDESVREQCRLCQNSSSEEALIDGCHCRDGPAKYHNSCIHNFSAGGHLFKCEICGQMDLTAMIEYDRQAPFLLIIGIFSALLGLIMVYWLGRSAPLSYRAALGPQVIVSS